MFIFESMSPKIAQLPDDLFAAGRAVQDSIVIHHFTSTSPGIKEKAILNRYAVSLVITGRKTMHFAEKSVHINDNEIHLLTAGHCIASIDIAKEKSFESVLVFFDDKELADFSVAHAALIEKNRQKMKPVPQAYMAFEKDEFIVHYTRSLLLMAGNKKLTGEMKRVKLHELLLYLLENHPEKYMCFSRSGKLSQGEMVIRRVVESNVLNKLSIEEMAFLCNLSVSTFKRQFKKIYGAAPNAWLLEQKMKMASQMLRQQNEKPGEIWFKLGFETHTGFTRSFKKRYGVTPKAYAVTG